MAASAATLVAGRARAAQPIKIGVLTDFAGPYADDSGQGSVVAAKLAIEDFRKLHGGLDVELISADFLTKPDVAANVASSWYDRDGVDMIIDVPVSSAALAVATVAKQKDKVAIFNAGASALTGSNCGPNHAHWAFDTYGLAATTGRAVVEAGGKSWFFVQANYAFGASLVADATSVIEASGGKVVGTVKYPFPDTSDYASFLLQAQSSGADVIGFASAGADSSNLIKQASEFGLGNGTVKLAALLCFIPQIHALGLAASKGLQVSEAFYWDLNDDTRALTSRYAPQVGGAKPCTIQAGCYSGVLHYLKAVAALGVDGAKKSGAAVIAKMKEIPTSDLAFGNGRLREDGRKIHDMHLFEVKAPAQSTKPWDYYKYLRTVPGERAFRPLAEGKCAMIHL
ncbi:ABC transporter substrate-binding protein [Bradyrhizobium sp. dw_78]|uniref:ABC transporter substrate-binding protein n=1 Tax=Bradyrhizobium sp. dw_78 TaxID=2719793 RepID=UPI00320BB37A